MTTEERQRQILRMYNQANAFFDCAQFCITDLHVSIGHGKSHVVPAIVNFAFACEVYLKTILIHYGKSANEVKRLNHHIDKLWRLLFQTDVGLANQIKNKVQSVFNEDDTFFERMLEESSNAFQEWRYIYESDSLKGHPQFLKYFCLVLQQECTELLILDERNSLE